jgi:hypothetical protein
MRCDPLRGKVTVLVSLDGGLCSYRFSKRRASQTTDMGGAEVGTVDVVPPSVSYKIYLCDMVSAS